MRNQQKGKRMNDLEKYNWRIFSREVNESNKCFAVKKNERKRMKGNEKVTSERNLKTGADTRYRSYIRYRKTEKLNVNFRMKARGIENESGSLEMR